MNKPLQNCNISIDPYREIIQYIHDCFENNTKSIEDMNFNVDGIIYTVHIQKKKVENLDINTNSGNLLDFFSRAIEIIYEKWRVDFKFWSTDRHKIYVTISTDQEIELVRQSISDLANWII